MPALRHVDEEQTTGLEDSLVLAQHHARVAKMFEKTLVEYDVEAVVGEGELQAISPDHPDLNPRRLRSLLDQLQTAGGVVQSDDIGPGLGKGN